jgi:hypothetical protein
MLKPTSQAISLLYLPEKKINSFEINLSDGILTTFQTIRKAFTNRPQK